MNILGINAYHGGASACLIKDGQLIAAAEEERFNRVKYCAGFPSEAVKWVLSEGGITASDLDHIGISRDPLAHAGRKLMFAMSHRLQVGFLRDRARNAARIRGIDSVLAEQLQIPRRSLKAKVHAVEHHRAHLASAFFVSPFTEAAVLSVDGMGDFVSTMWGVGSDRHIRVTGSVLFPHSLGLFYTAVTQWLGFTKYGDEGKVMGLAPLGTPRYLDRMLEIVRLQSDGTFELDLDYFRHHNEGVAMTWASGSPEIGTLYSPRFVDVFGDPRVPGAPILEHHQDVAASLQAALEEVELQLVRRVQRETGMKALCLAGGVALNSAFNGRILRETDFTDIYIQPAAGDAGTALGVCYYIHNHVLGLPRAFVMEQPGTGPAFSNAAIESAIDKASLAATALDDPALTARVAELLEEGNVVGWFQGRMEWGPRALGHRSILADPRRSDMKDILNARIKHREPFRPFAPSIKLEAVGQYFDQVYPDPFMLKIYDVLPDKRSVIPAVTHVDGTGRLQSVDRRFEPLYWSLIDQFERRTGVPVVLNTSFNENEPIVCRPEEAIDCFRRTRMDVLVIGNYLLRK